MDEQTSYALRQLAPWAQSTGLVEVKRALVACAEEAAEAEDGADLARRLIDRADRPASAAAPAPSKRQTKNPPEASPE
jgi:hypothetical protein